MSNYAWCTLTSKLQQPFFLPVSDNISFYAIIAHSYIHTFIYIYILTYKHKMFEYFSNYQLYHQRGHHYGSCQLTVTGFLRTFCGNEQKNNAQKQSCGQKMRENFECALKKNSGVQDVFAISAVVRGLCRFSFLYNQFCKQIYIIKHTINKVQHNKSEMTQR